MFVEAADPVAADRPPRREGHRCHHRHRVGDQRGLDAEGVEQQVGGIDRRRQGRIEEAGEVVPVEVVVAEQDAAEDLLQGDDRDHQQVDAGEVDRFLGLGGEDDRQQQLRDEEAERHQRQGGKRPGGDQPRRVLRFAGLVEGDALRATHPEDPSRDLGDQQGRRELAAAVGAQGPGDDDPGDQVGDQNRGVEAHRPEHPLAHAVAAEELDQAFGQVGVAKAFGVGLRLQRGRRGRSFFFAQPPPCLALLAPPLLVAHRGVPARAAIASA